MPPVGSLFSIQVTARARREIRSTASWWSEHRDKAPHAFREDVARAFDTLARQPRLGPAATNEKLTGVRRLHLRRLRYDLYYRVQEASGRVEILAFWHASRGAGPDLG